MVESSFVIGLGTSNDVKGSLIRFVTRGWCSHAWLEYYSRRFGSFWVIHATNRGVVRQRVFDVWHEYPTFRRFEVKWDLDPGIEKANNYIGTPYDFRSTATNAFLLLMRDYAGVYGTIERDPERFNCSELVTAILKWSNIPGCERLDPEATTPIKLYNICAGNSALFREI